MRGVGFSPLRTAYGLCLKLTARRARLAFRGLSCWELLLLLLLLLFLLLLLVLLLLLLIYLKLTKLQKFLQKQLQNCSSTTCDMLIKVNSLIYKTKINVTMKLKIKITYVLIMCISLHHGKSNRKTNKKQALVMDCHQNSVPP